MIDRLSRTHRNLALALLGGLTLWFFWTVRSVLNPLILGYLLAYIVHPLVLWLESRGWRRRRAVNLIFVGGFLLATVVTAGIFYQGSALVQTLRRENENLVANFSQRVESFLREHRGLFETILGEAEEEPLEDATGAAAEPGAPPPAGEGEPRAPELPPAEQGEPPLPPAGAGDLPPPEESIDDPLDDPDARPEKPFTLAAFLEGLRERIGGEVGGAGEFAVRGFAGAWNLAQRFFGSLVALATLILLLPIYTYFLLFELDRIHGFVRRYTPVRERERFARIGLQIGEVLSNFFRGRLTVCFLKGICLWFFLAAAGVRYSLLIGMVSGFLALVPFVGPLFGFAFAFMVALLDRGYGLVEAALRTGAPFLVAELIEGYVLVPKILGDSLGLHPVVVLVSVFMGGAALGMFGFLIALPLTAAIVILARELVLPALAAFADEDGERAPRDRAPPDATPAPERPEVGSPF